MSILREIITKLTVQTDPAKIARFQSALTQAKEESKKITSALSGVAAQLAGIAAGVAGGLGFRAITTELAEQTHILNNHAAAVGMTVEEYSRLQAASAQFVEETGKDMRDFLADLADYGRDALANPTGGYAMDLKALGVELTDHNGKLKSQFDLMLAVSDAMTKVPLTAERMGIMSAVFSTGALEMSEFLQLGREGILAQMAAVDAAAITTKENVKVSKEFRGAMMGVKTIVQGVRVEMGMKLMPVLTKMAKTMTVWWKTSENGPKLLKRIEGGLRLISVIIGIILALKFIAFMRLAVVITLAWVKATWAAAAALGAVKIALIAIPVILATMALLIEDIIVWAEGGDSAIGAFIDRFAESDSVLGRLARWLRDHKDQLVTGARAIADGFFWFVGAVKSAGPAVLNTLRAAWDKVQAFFNGGAQGIIAALGQGLAAAMGQLWAWIKAPFVALGEKISGWVSDLMGIEVVARIVEAVSSVFASVRSVLGSIWSVVEETAKGFYEAFGPLLPAVIALFKALGQLAWALIKLAIAAAQIIWAVWSLKGKVIWAVIKAMAPHIWALIKRIVSFIADAIGKVAGWVGTAATWLAEKIGWAVENVVKPALSWITEAIGWLAEKAAWVAGILAEVFGWLGEKIAWVAGIAAEVATWLAEKITWVAEKVAWFAGEVAAVVTWVAEKVGWLAGKIAEGVGLVASGLAYILNTYITPAINWLTSGVDTVTAVFKRIAEGIKGMFTSAFDAVMTLAQPIIDIINDLKGTVDWAANKLGLGDDSPAGIDQGVGQIKAFQSQLGASGGFGLGFSGAMGAASNTTTVGSVTVQVQGSTNMGPGDLSRATQQGVEAGMQNKEAARDLSVGGG